ncbi:uncharacterized protein F4812DRAFT_308850 [Daldinia caldariorum]|uniref:uncharacterized protein n=1 Tax=Daldinia caldariorum TaxID=326644 RepID=UPI002007459F|nr:uncharacterized protein F4812DRAFT_308850 [Daldinia caldariorum]KAI1469979.1 hypothetical protein F4812DRAFT_308850 [Daldinia caldariorum]
MEMVQTLVRSVVRAFYTNPEDRRMILIIDALVRHTTLRDNDLSYLMHLNTKDLHRICGKLREDHLLQIHLRPEIREGKDKPQNRIYYYIDYRQAIDAIKYRTFLLDKKVQGEATPQQEKKEYFCPLCKAEWTMLDVVDNNDPVRGFLCHRCNTVLIFDPDREAGGHELSTRLNSQIKFIIEVLPKLDAVTIPDVDFETLLSQAAPVFRDEANKIAPSVVAESLAKPTAVRGMANTGPQSIAISITDTDGPTDAEKEAERARKEEVAQMNALPEWHTRSTVSGLSFGGANSTLAVKDDTSDKKPDELVGDASHDKAMEELFKSLQKSRDEEARRKAEQEAEEEDEDVEESEDEEFVEISANVSSTGDKRPASSGPTSAADTPASEDRPSKKVKLEEPVNRGGDSEDEDDVQFEDV